MNFMIRCSLSERNLCASLEPFFRARASEVTQQSFIFFSAQGSEVTLQSQTYVHRLKVYQDRLDGVAI